MNSCYLRLRGIVSGEPHRRFLERTGYPDDSREGVPHAKRVVRRIRDVSDRVSPHVEFPVNERILLEDCAFRIADGRGPGSGDEVVRLLRKDYGNLLSPEALVFMEACLRSVSSLSAGRRARHLFVPETFSQRAIALADLGEFLDGWEAWVREAVRSGPEDMDAWICETEACMDGNVFSALRALEPFLPDGYYRELIHAFDGVRSRLSSLRKEVPERDAVRELLLAGRP